MKDNLGRLWKVGNQGAGKSPVFVVYTKHKGGDVKVLGEEDIAFPGNVHASRVRKVGLVCNGVLFGPPGFQLCGKCAALVDVRR